ncbi:hypothetical protein O6H91_11G043400 [Diphasiastrum complanatum]|uniref:Uncharacterized protein n=8 Tax=Diphasiastrum complanatum TaxID=34168 RepID=A0ACC2C8H9_DIPCM|nr:hypothetical protein O6H91_11G043000 [Diphasiastrum complanatum]KAJ7538307.1 hypothetical protein O6H91_11G043000 [Diphasiastrum complanatum]KAJ7538308.1 hypothetical protein O6H91_11G043000 [Diphasiastrum complanatum]KAJ7538309.1 hypothetical protein O6H91_11G043000 [Diphasiastrum complanatum]KAJ7538310.1 hypothetical protein O6H91_11G043000 [Diphasiastrum complanatum]
MQSSFGSMPPSSYKDRTTEFLAIADRLRKSQASAVNHNSLTANGSLEGPTKLQGLQAPQTSGYAQSEFNRRASQIGLSIHQTSQKLSKLAKLAKRTSMFDDPIVEIQELTVVVKQDITALNEAISDLQRLCDTRNDSANSSKHSTEHSSTVVDNLKSRLMTTTKEFKDVLTMRTENLKVHANRRQLFSATASKERVNPFMRQRPLATKSNAISSDTPPPWSNGSASTDVFDLRRRTVGEGTSSPRSAQGHMEQQLAPVQDTSYMQSRAEAIQNVESTISELSNIFTQLATMVAEQGEMAIRIDENMDDTLANVEGAQGALLKYLNRISSNRWLIMKIFFVLLIFLLIFVFFVA